MQFRTELSIVPDAGAIGYDNKILLTGSCFSENIGSWLESRYFNVLANPFGILYNPASIARSFRILLDEKRYTEADLFLHQGQYHSFDHHSRYSGYDAPTTLLQLNELRTQATRWLEQTDVLLITFGTAWIFEHALTGQVVANCHKLPDSHFHRRRMTVSEITALWQPLIGELSRLNPRIRIIFTVSPIRHLKDTLHGNQLSKATLLLAIDQLCGLSDNISYFPAYELLTDDLRDYRFYASDMVHPSDTAIEYIRMKFAEAFFTKETRLMVSECEKIERALNHRPNNPQSASYRNFLLQNIEKLNHLIDKNPIFTGRKPLARLEELLKKTFE